MSVTTAITVRRAKTVVLAVIVLPMIQLSTLHAADLPNGFVYLRDVDASILQDMRYATPHNFTGKRVPGYKSDECVLAKPVAEALAAVQLDLLAGGLSLKVYDCYRPDRAVKAFLRWAASKKSTVATRAYHPGLSKRQVVSRGYVAPRSTHSTGRAVDLTIVETAAPPGSATSTRNETSCIAPVSERRPDTSVDMGTGFDCFHVRSHTAHPAIKGAARQWRNTLVAMMKKRGFRNYAKEWWHFNLRAPGFGARRDFVAPDRNSAKDDRPEKPPAD